MSIHLTIDEMLQILEDEGSPLFPLAKSQAEIAARLCAMAVQIVEPRLVWSDEVNRERLEFGGTCASFSPKEPGPVPDCLVKIDVEVQEWIDMSDAMAEQIKL